MSDRRERVLDAAITVLGTGGSRALTHRAVDAAAGLPAGSASNVARSRPELVAGVLDRLLEREVAAWERLAATDPDDGGAGGAGGTEDRTVRTITALLRELTGPGREVTLARHAIVVEAALDPVLQDRIAAARARIERWGADWLARLGTPLDDDGVRAVLAVVEGWLVLAVSTPAAAPDPEPLLRRVLGAR